MVENRLAAALPLNGEWSLTLAGKTAPVQVPGVWETQGFADVEGPALYHKTVHIPADWAGSHIRLEFDAVSYYAEAFVNGQPVGAHEGMWSAFSFDITAAARCGEANQIELRVTKPGRDGSRFHYREVIVGFIPYVATTFGGVWGAVRLTAHRAPAFTDVYVGADAVTGTVSLRFGLDSATDCTLLCEILNAAGEVVAADERSAVAGAHTFELVVAQPALWSPSSPALYTARLRLKQNEETLAETARRFGFRRLHSDGAKLRLNDHPAHLRGILSWGWNPDTLAPIFTDEQIRDEYRRVRSLGFNLYKLCLFVPSSRWFEIADEEGMLLWLELPLWLPRLSEHLRQQARAEYADILRAVHHHPSIVIYSLGCELGADMADAALLGDLNTLTRAVTCGVLVCDNSGSGEAYSGLGFDYADFNDYHFYCDLHNFLPLVDHFHRDWRTSRPWIFGEFNDCDDFRDFQALFGDRRPAWRDYYGIEGSPERWAAPEQETRIRALDLPFAPAALQRLSRRGSLLVRKTIIEYTRSRAGMGGYVVTGLRDTPISTSGMFDDLNQPKYDAAAFRAFNGDAVLVLEQGRTRHWVHGGDRPAPADRFNLDAGVDAHYWIVLGHTAPVAAGRLHWRLRDGEAVIASGESATPALPADGPHELAAISFPTPVSAAARGLILDVELVGVTANQWPLWVYPVVEVWPPLALYDPAGTLDGFDALFALRLNAVPESSDRLLVAGVWSPDVRAYVARGGRALVIQMGEGALPVKRVPFWREAVRLLMPHPVWQVFPNDGSASLQFYALASDAALDTAALAAALPEAALHPILRRLDARLFTVTDYLLEAEIGAGRAIFATLRFAGGAGDQPRGLDATPAGRWLLRCLAAHLHGLP